MYDYILIYIIVLLNALCQMMLIWRQRRIRSVRWLFIGGAAAVPLVVVTVMRTLVICGVIHGRLAEQTAAERLITQGSSILLMAGPWLVTLFAVYCDRRQAHATAVGNLDVS